MLGENGHLHDPPRTARSSNLTASPRCAGVRQAPVWSPAHAVIPFRIANPDAPFLLVPAGISGRGPFDFVADTGNGAPYQVLLAP